ncbi:hypothetical protein LS70_002785 [Helicobacter sp. MIT 11-5569]|uniref:hypothetical protein n=1 Tax=Helicobacter sp. MIT 11-5569 TaxID=1548151 RepID=UPI00051FDA2D|nr:hypothetical protein [Helicobacter sp. MIT 11-5569]TLD84490.1 hypothetical protein LS70_002785 [Helicobacter sp. MIT 11-5569]
MKIDLVFILSLCGILFLGGCATNAQKMFSLDSSSLEERQLQTRVFETNDDKKIFDSSIATLQDLEYTIEEVDRNFGVITGNKSADATEAGQVVGAIFMALFVSADAAVNMTDATQHIRATIVIIPKPAHKKTYVRLTIQRVVFNAKGGVTKAETIKDEAIYQKFFEALSKSVFLEGHIE